MNYAMSQGHVQNTSQLKKIFSETSGKGHILPPM